MAVTYLGTSPQGGQAVDFVQYITEGVVFVDGFESSDTSAWTVTVD
jgi:hypothetical protein